MAFEFTNTTVSSTKAVSLFDMKEASLYGKRYSSTKTSMTNGTTTGSSEIVDYYCSPIDKVDVPNEFVVNYPSPIATSTRKSKAIQYGVNLYAMHVANGSDPATRVERPMKVHLQVIMEDAAEISNDEVMTLIERTVSSLIREDGTERIGFLRKNITAPDRN